MSQMVRGLAALRPSRVFLVVFATAAACSGATRSNPVPNTTGTIQVSVRLTARTGGPAVTRVQIEVEPAGVYQSLSLDAVMGDYVGSVVVPTGTQTVTATAYARTDLVGTGSGVANVSSHGVTSLSIKILDNSTPPPSPDFGPIITSLTISNNAPGVGETVSLSVTATDPNGDAMTYQWTDNCGGVFGSSAAATTTWYVASAQQCSITASVMSKGKTDVGTLAVVVSVASGQLSVTALFIPVPYITSIRLNAGDFSCTIGREATDASCRPSIPQRTVATATVTFDPMPAGSGGDVTLTDNCGGSSTRSTLDLAAGTATFSWTAPAASGSCVLSATASRETLSDVQRIAVAIQ